MAGACAASLCTQQLFSDNCSNYFPIIAAIIGNKLLQRDRAVIYCCNFGFLAAVLVFWLGLAQGGGCELAGGGVDRAGNCCSAKARDPRLQQFIVAILPAGGVPGFKIAAIYCCNFFRRGVPGFQIATIYCCNFVSPDPPAQNESDWSTVPNNESVWLTIPQNGFGGPGGVGRPFGSSLDFGWSTARRKPLALPGVRPGENVCKKPPKNLCKLWRTTFGGSGGTLATSWTGPGCLDNYNKRRTWPLRMLGGSQRTRRLLEVWGVFRRLVSQGFWESRRSSRRHSVCRDTRTLGMLSASFREAFGGSYWLRLWLHRGVGNARKCCFLIFDFSCEWGFYFARTENSSGLGKGLGQGGCIDGSGP